MKNILLTNDDGVFAEGIEELERVLGKKYNVTIVAPDRERSAASHSLTLHHPLRIVKVKENKFAIDGTPTDCVILAINSIMKKVPDLVISGINNGPNMGEDILYSGTVAAAVEAMSAGLPSIAVSLASHQKGNFSESAEILDSLLSRDLFSILSPKTIININIPPLSLKKIKGIKVTKLGHRIYKDFIEERKDPRGRPYFWMGGQSPEWSGEGKTDFKAIKEGYVSITPINIDMTNYSYFPEIKNWIKGVNSITPPKRISTND
ncbi:MAG: 5'/3'-nucleotidase SurE [Candidatus Cloacimonetes bacterium]|nr:5'/3'-nucleotidase SurE [Candidatus Cloacimonadota bacterium]